MRGFTLVELMLVVLILSIILAGTFTVLSMGRRSWQIGTSQVQVQQEARRAMDSMIRELREASSIDPSTFNKGVSENIIRFTLRGKMIKFALSAGQLQRTEGGTITILANDISGIQFYLFGGNVLYIVLRAQRSAIFGPLVEATLNSQVVLRN